MLEMILSCLALFGLGVFLGYGLTPKTDEKTLKAEFERGRRFEARLRNKGEILDHIEYRAKIANAGEIIAFQRDMIQRERNRRCLSGGDS